MIVAVCLLIGGAVGYVLFVDVSFNPNAGGNGTSSPGGAEVPPPLTGEELSFESLSGYFGNHEKQEVFIVRTPEGARDAGATVPLSRIDFSKEMAVVVFYGRQPTSGYAVDIIKVVEGADAVEVTVFARKPGGACRTTGEISYPYHAVKFRKTEKYVFARIIEDIDPCVSRGEEPSR